MTIIIGLFNGGSMKKKIDAQYAHCICSVCGKEINGDHVIIQTRRHTTLHIHHECIKTREV